MSKVDILQSPPGDRRNKTLEIEERETRQHIVGSGSSRQQDADDEGPSGGKVTEIKRGADGDGGKDSFALSGDGGYL